MGLVQYVFIIFSTARARWSGGNRARTASDPARVASGAQFFDRLVVCSPSDIATVRLPMLLGWFRIELDIVAIALAIGGVVVLARSLAPFAAVVVLGVAPLRRSPRTMARTTSTCS